MSKLYDKLLKLLLVGESGVGKTCLICQYASSEFNEHFTSTIGVDFKMKTCEIDGHLIKMQIWDTAGQERFEAITKQFFRRAQGCVLVYDICSRSSFEALAKWLLYVKQYTKQGTAIVMVGNKCDLEKRRKVPRATAQLFANENGLKFFEVSAKDSFNLTKPFQEICREILKLEHSKPESEREPEEAVKINLDLKQTKIKSTATEILSDCNIRMDEVKTRKGDSCC